MASFAVPAPAAELSPLQRGAACIAARLHSPDLSDPYLAYLYPAESPASLGGPEPAAAALSYRRIDAAILLALLDREPALPASLREAARAARDRLAGVAPGWRRMGIADPAGLAEAPGIALDTFCIVGWLLKDREMAKMAAAARHGDAWIPEGFYDGEERFRRAADESWCLRLLAEVLPEAPLPEAPIERIAATLAADAAGAPSERGTFYEALHLGMALDPEAAAGRKAQAHQAAAALWSWAAAHEADAARGDSLPEWINLASAAWLDRHGMGALRERAVVRMHAAQDEDGCWRLPGAPTRDYGSSFLTLRALLALAPHEVRPAQ